MSLMPLMIAGACMTATGNGQQACSKSLEAGTKQAGIELFVDKTEDKYNKKANRTAYSLLGQSGMDVVGGSLFIVKTAVDKNVAFGLPTMGICDSANSQIGLDSYKLKLEWGF
jgi:hypothetical protein